MSGSGRLGCVMALVLLATLSATACGAGASSGPHSLPALSSAATPAATPPSSASPSTSAASGKAAELAAATAVVRRYYAIANNFRHDMDSRSLAALFTPRCVCQAQARAVRSAAAKHEHYTDHAHLNSLVFSSEGPGRADVLVDLDASRGGLVKADGTRVTYAAHQRHVKRVFRLERLRGSWLISGIELA